MQSLFEVDEMRVYVTACPRNCYSTCSIRVHVEEGRIHKIEPHPGNRATPDGLCLKGLSLIERALSPDRIVFPLRRKRGGAGFQRISWDEALGRVADTLKRLDEQHGPKSVLYYTGSGTKGLLNQAGLQFFKRFGGCTVTFGDLCWPSGLEATRLTLGENKHNAPWDLVHARLIVLWGKNPAETNIHQMTFIDEALKNGARLVVVDPRRTPSSERADLLIQPRPGTDAALALAIAHLLIKENGVDSSFVEKQILGYPEFRDRALAFSLDEAERICDVPLSAMQKLAGYFRDLRPATLCAGFGMQRYTNSGQTVRALIALPAITGNIGIQGGGWQFANLQSYLFGPASDDPDTDAFRAGVSVARLGTDMPALDDPPLKMIWVERANPVTQNPETGKVLDAIRALDFRVVVDQFMTDTAREADIILPAKTMFEQSDLINAYWHPYIQFKQKVVDPPEEVKPETEIFALLAERLGLKPCDAGAAMPGASDREVEAWLEERLAPFPGLTLDLLKSGPQIAPGHEEVAFSDLHFPTPSGKIELLSSEAEKRWGVDRLPSFKEPVESAARKDARYPLYLMTPNSKDRIHSQYNNLPMIRSLNPRPYVQMSPLDAEKRGISHRDKVAIFNDRGRIQMEARLDFSLKPGCVVIANGWWIPEGGAVNFLSCGRETDMGHGTAFHDNLVDVAKVEA
ncbi:MAG: molybdopterin-dependent oxidoreductase [Planctomycetota bacterium]